jgi:Zn-dependent protease
LNAQSLIAGAIGILLALDIHEFFHAWMADQLGDPTARYMGRVSLNPLVHLDPLGTVMMLMAAVTGRGIGWGKPVPINPLRLRYGPRVGMGIVSFAGPFANLLTATVFGLPLRMGVALPGTLLLLFYYITIINIGLAVFNLIPLPPLDGYGVVQGVLGSIRGPTSYRLSQNLSMLERQGPFLLFFLIVAGQYMRLDILGMFMNPLVKLFSRLILGI